MLQSQHILISGAGIAGLALARRFEQLGIHYKIIEKHPKPSDHGLGIALPFNAIQALRELDLAKAVFASSYQVNRITYAKKNGDILSQASLLDAPLNQDHFVAMYRHQLQDILFNSLRQKVHYETTITDFENSPDGVEVTCSDQQLSAHYDLVISAEGVHANLRQKCFLDEQTVIHYDIQNWRFIHPMKNHGLQPKYYFATSELFMIYPISADLLYCYGHVYDEKKQYDNTAHIENLTHLFKNFGDIVPDIINHLKNKKIYAGRLKSVRRPYYSKKRIAFIGDASGACSPLLQQGAAAAFEDVLCLSEQLKLHSIDKALSEYESIRHARVSWILKTSDAPIQKIKIFHHPIGAIIRNTVFKRQEPLNVIGWKYLANQDK